MAATWCSRRLACIALGSIIDAELDRLIAPEPEALVAERAEVRSTEPTVANDRSIQLPPLFVVRTMLPLVVDPELLASLRRAGVDAGWRGTRTAISDALVLVETEPANLVRLLRWFGSGPDSTPCG